MTKLLVTEKLIITKQDFIKLSNISEPVEFIKFEDFSINEIYDVIFYDAFGSHAQPELWTYSCMKKCNDLIAPNGVWVSYCAKGSVRRDLETIGFEVSRLPGPPGKREMLRAIKV